MNTIFWKKKEKEGKLNIMFNYRIPYEIYFLMKLINIF